MSWITVRAFCPKRLRTFQHILAACAVAILAMAQFSYGQTAPAADPADAEAMMLQALRAGTPGSDAVRDALARTICEGTAPTPTAIGLILSAQDAGIVDSEIGAGIASGAILVRECDIQASNAVGRVVGDMGTLGLRNAFVTRVRGDNGDEILVTLATTDPTVAFDGVVGYLYETNIPGNPCDQPGCN